MKIVKTASRSETGLVRKTNEDSVLCLSEMNVFAVADGMGGGSEGELASRMVCEDLARYVRASVYSRRVDEIAVAVSAANARIFEYAKERGFRQMGSTVALIAVDDTGLERGVVGYVGDSRVYRVRNGAAELLTRDHSVGAELDQAVAGSGGRFSARSNPLAHILTRAIGTKEEVQLEWRKVDIADGDRFVICSDGVHDVVETDALAGLVARGALEKAADALARKVVACGAPDNYSFVIVEIGGAQ